MGWEGYEIFRHVGEKRGSSLRLCEEEAAAAEEATTESGLIRSNLKLETSCLLFFKCSYREVLNTRGWKAKVGNILDLFFFDYFL